MKLNKITIKIILSNLKIMTQKTNKKKKMEKQANFFKKNQKESSNII